MKSKFFAAVLLVFTMIAYGCICGGTYERKIIELRKLKTEEKILANKTNTITLEHKNLSDKLDNIKANLGACRKGNLEIAKQNEDLKSEIKNLETSVREISQKYLLLKKQKNNLEELISAIEIKSLRKENSDSNF